MPLDRRTPLRPDPEKVREFIQRGRERSQLGMSAREASVNLGRNALRSGVSAKDALDGMQRTSAALKRSARKRRAAIPKAVRARVFARSGGMCICGCDRKADTIHHALEVNRWPHLELIEANMVGVYHDCNWAHHYSPNARIRRDRLPQCVRDLVRDEGPKAEAEIERYYA